MHVQIVTFTLNEGADPDAVQADFDDAAPAFAAAPGLIAKIWLHDPATNTYGGVYTWEDRAAFDAYTRSELFAALAADPNVTGIESRDFAVLDGPTRVTRGLVGVPA
jgi:heme-degrading monooxygenase HmoA